jgi:hypothetical protein
MISPYWYVDLKERDWGGFYPPWGYYNMGKSQLHLLGFILYNLKNKIDKDGRLSPRSASEVSIIFSYEA